MAITGENDHLNVVSRFGKVRDDEITRHYSTPWVRGQWYHIVIRLRFGIDSDAMLQVWLDGENIVDETDNFNMGYHDGEGDTNPSVTENPKPMYWKYGLYRQSAPQVQSIKVANMEIGSESLAHRIENPRPIVP